jgi:hypothetical protein
MSSAQEDIPMRITIALKRDEYDRLSEIARAERRPMRDQAAWIVARAVTEQAETEVKPRE